MTLFVPATGSVWWRIPVWTALTAITVIAAHGASAKIAAGVLMAGAWITLQFLEGAGTGVYMSLVLVSSALGLAACYASTSGAAPVVVCVAVARAPFAFGGVVLRAYTAVMTVAFGVTVAVISHSLLGLAAGVAVPLLIERTEEQRELIRERDRARALLVEAQAGREAASQAAALRERGRIAREMHDVLAHTLAGLSVQLQAVRAVAARENAGAAVLEPLDKAATLARDGLTEARAAVGTLRDPIGLGLAELPALVDRHPGRATLSIAGEPREVSAEAGHAVYRAVQESLTNSARYAPGTTVTVTLTWQADELDASVRDDGPAPGREAVPGQGTGLGLAGMAERLTQVGGHVETGPDSGGWLVRAVVPVVTS